ncbi:MAG TPA: cyclodeaminase/cyclohydrolase family protein [Candidatus Avalokitesvara rifleensis]|uniref:cyclodeaminase/cyclohydrolase family protein n=1 Tax=Candidatus Avalokitesvara rifleensis TaxID=3367620 RepID=UPI0027126929|nr:cyclodeaminase/cyclohydrolase family protein [Candidatus Brocadiales bacterium]
MYCKEPLEKYLNDAAAGTPTPGGGSVSALVSALGTTMASMSVNMTVGRPKFEEVEALLKDKGKKFEQARIEFLELMHKDMEVYQGVLDAYKLPKVKPDEKERRTEAIQNALKGAMGVPLRLLRRSLAVLEDLAQIVDKVNPNLIGDIAVAAVLAQAGLRGGWINVHANLVYIKDEGLNKKTRTEVDHAVKRAEALFKDIMAKVEGAFTK